MNIVFHHHTSTEVLPPPPTALPCSHFGKLSSVDQFAGELSTLVVVLMHLVVMLWLSQVALLSRLHSECGAVPEIRLWPYVCKAGALPLSHTLSK